MQKLDTPGVDLASLSADRHRPSYHFLSPDNWMNDPNGLLHWRGRCHLFYQYNPSSPQSEDKHWGHAVSDDLVHWEHLPIALAPDPDGPDTDGVFSGCAVGLHDHVVLMYTGVRGPHQLPCIATNDDPELLAWTKYAGNPVITAPPADLDLVFFRDHTLWQEGDTWYMGIGSGLRGQGGTVLVFRSPDLHDWTYLHPLCIGDLDRTNPLWGGTGWECPDFFAISNDRVLIVSGHDAHPRNVLWFTGGYQDQRLTVHNTGLVDGGPSFYAPQSYTDDAGRRVMFGWMRERRTVAQQVAAGWSGVMTLPRILSVLSDGSLVSAPAPEIAQLRTRHRTAVVDASGLVDIRGDTLELLATFDARATEPAGLSVRTSLDGKEATVVTYTPATQTVTLDTRASSIDPDVSGVASRISIPPAADGSIRLRVFLDRSVIEVFVNDRICLSDRIYPVREESDRIRVVGLAALSTLEVWDIGPCFLPSEAGRQSLSVDHPQDHR